MTAGAIFRNCGESSTSTAHSLGLRREPTLHVSGVILLSNGDGRFTSFAVVCFGTVVSFLVFSVLFPPYVATPPFPSDWRGEMTMRTDTSPAGLSQQRRAELYSRTSGESVTSVKGNSETVGFSSAPRTRKSSFRRGILRSRRDAFDSRKRARFLAARRRREGGREGKGSSPGATCTGFSIAPRLSLRTATPAGYGRLAWFTQTFFCGDILSYKIADIHRISIEMAADVAAAIGRRALSRPLRDCLTVGRPSHSSGSIARNFSRLRRSHYYNAVPPAADFKYPRHAKISIVLLP